MNTERLILILVYGIGLSLMVASIGILIWNRNLSKTGVTVDGKVSDVVWVGSTGSSLKKTKMWSPQFSWHWNNMEYISMSTLKSTSLSYEIGDTVEITIDPANPERMLVQDFTHRWVLPILFAAAAIITMIGAHLARKWLLVHQ